MLHDTANNNVKILHVTPGHNTFITIPLINKQAQNEVYTVKILDPDHELLPMPELRLVSDQAELSHWVVEGIVERPPAWNMITTQSDVILKSGQQINLLFKFITFRDVTYSTVATQPTRKTIARRQV
jgi:hypothetical protein